MEINFIFDSYDELKELVKIRPFRYGNPKGLLRQNI